MHKMTTLASATLVLAFAACGPSAKIGGKDGTAQAIHALTQVSQTGADRASSGVNLTDATVSCSKGGTATLSAFATKVDLTDGISVLWTYQMDLNNCALATSDQGDAVYNGTMNVTQKIVTSSTTVAVSQAFKGKVTVGGAFDDFLDLDITDTLDVVDLGKSGSVTFKLVGTATTSTQTYTYDESVTITGGAISTSK